MPAYRIRSSPTVTMSPAPIVIVECGFLTNEEEEALLGQETYQRKLAWNIHMGIMRYLNTDGESGASS